MIARIVRATGADAAFAQVRLEGPEEEGGRPAWRVEAMADRWGDVEFLDLPTGHATLEVREPGFVWTRRSVLLVEGSATVVRIDEPEGRTVRVRVLGDDGRPAVGASVRIHPDCGVDHAVVEDGVQVLGRYTDAAGECFVPRVPEGGAWVRVQLGSCSESATLDRDAVEVVLKRPE